MTTFTTEDRERAFPRVGSKWAGVDTRKDFTILAVWNPNEEHDPWVKYCNEDGKEFTCRLEAFLSRFTTKPD